MGIPFQWQSLDPELPGVPLSKAAGAGLWSWPMFLSRGEGAVTAVLTVSCLESSPGHIRGNWPTEAAGSEAGWSGKKAPGTSEQPKDP